MMGISRWSRLWDRIESQQASWNVQKADLWSDSTNTGLWGIMFILLEVVGHL